MGKKTTNHINHQINIEVKEGGINNINYGDVHFYGTTQQPKRKDEAPIDWTEEQQAILKKAVEKGLLEECNDGFVWKKSKGLLDYFLGCLILKDHPVPQGNVLIWNGTTEKVDGLRPKLNKLFNTEDIGKYRQKQINHATVPGGHEQVDELFDNE